MKRKRMRLAIQSGIVAGLVLDTIRLRRRLTELPTLDDDASPPPGDDGYRLLTANGTRLHARTIATAAAHARAEGLAALDLVPRDLPAAQSLDLLRELDPATYRSDRMARGRGAYHAVLADEALLHRAGVNGNGHDRRAVELARAIVDLKLHAPASTGVVVAPHMQADAELAAQAPEVIAAWHGTLTTRALSLRAAWLATLLGSAAFGRRWAAAALGAWSAQPVLVFAGSRSLKPADLLSYSAKRLLNEPRGILAVLRAARPLHAARAAMVASRRPAYHADIAAGTERFFEPERETCPWCGASDLRVRLRMPDLMQHKPGRFRLDECRACGHFFQNPRLNGEGLEFYYRDAYDGLGEEQVDLLFSWCTRFYHSRAQTLEHVGTPASWLDVGTGHGHFCNVARDVWPTTVFDGLDMTDGIELAQRRGWVERGYRGTFVDLAPEIAGQYDVVSMFHYLEHVPDPQGELDAARTALRPGGHLLIEVPDPQSRWGNVLGKWWLPVFQPQHLNLFPVANLRRRLEEHGFTVVLEQHAESHLPVDLVAAAMAMLRAAAPEEDVPWRAHPPGRLARLTRAGMVAASLPMLTGAAVADLLIAPMAARLGLTGTYRLLARRN